MANLENTSSILFDRAEAIAAVRAFREEIIAMINDLNGRSINIPLNSTMQGERANQMIQRGSGMGGGGSSSPNMSNVNFTTQNVQFNTATMQNVQINANGSFTLNASTVNNNGGATNNTTNNQGGGGGGGGRGNRGNGRGGMAGSLIIGAFLGRRLANLGLDTLSGTIRDLEEESRLQEGMTGTNITPQLAAETAKKNYEIVKKENSGIAGFLRRAASNNRIATDHLAGYSDKEDVANDPRVIEAGAKAAVVTAEKEVAFEKDKPKYESEMEKGREEILKSTKSAYEAALSGLDKWKKDQFEFAKQLEDEGHKKEADNLRQQTIIVDIVKRRNAALNEDSRISGLKLDVTESYQAADRADQEAGGDYIGAKYQKRRDDIKNTVTAAETKARDETDPAKRAAAEGELTNARRKAAADNIMVAQDEARERAAIQAQSDDKILSIQKRHDDLMADANHEGNEQRVKDQHDALDKEIKDLQTAYNLEKDQTKKHFLELELERAKHNKKDNDLAIDQIEANRQRQAVARFDLATDNANNSDRGNDYQSSTQRIRDRWKIQLDQMPDTVVDPKTGKRIANPEKVAAMKNRDADVAANQRAGDRNIASTNQDAREAELQAGGYGAMADLSRFDFDFNKQIYEAGGDLSQRKAISNLALAQLDLMKRRQLRTGVFKGSNSDFADMLQEQVLNGGGSTINQINSLQQAIKKGAGQGTAAGQDAIFADAGKNLNTAADKLIENAKRLFILDN